MNSSEMKEISLACNDFFKSTKKFQDVRASIENKKENGFFKKEQVEEIRDSYRERLEALEKFDKVFSQFEKFMTPELYRSLKNIISSEISGLKEIVGNAESFLDGNNYESLAFLVVGFDAEKDISSTLDKEMSNFVSDLGFNLLMQAMEETITLEDLQLMITAFEPRTELYNSINKVIDVLEERERAAQKEEEPTDEMAEEVEPEHKAPTSTQPAGVDAAPTQEPRKPTLAEKIAAINYEQGKNLNAATQEVMLDEKFDELSAQIEELQSKEKLTVRETFKLRRLLEQQLFFEKYSYDLEEQNVFGKVRRRNRKLSSNAHKIDDKESKLERSEEKFAAYNSKTMRFFSARRQGKLKEKLTELREKQGKLTGLQKASAMARFDKESKKLMRKANRKAVIDQLRDYRKALFKEMGNIGHDIIVRFSSTKKKDMPLLLKAPVLMPDDIISLDERVALEGPSMAA